MSSVHNRYEARLVLKHRILVFKLDFKLDPQLCAFTGQVPPYDLNDLDPK